jgi:hypothetical protein
VPANDTDCSSEDWPDVTLLVVIALRTADGRVM